MRTVNIHEAKTNLSRLIEAVENGEEVVIARSGKPVAMLIAYPPPRRRAAWKARFGWPRTSAPLSTTCSTASKTSAKTRARKGEPMRMLLDTRLALWWQGMRGKVPGAASDMIEGPAEAVYVSRASLWEMSIKICMGKLSVHFKPG